MIVCSACNAENLDGKTTCHHCGATLPPPAMVDCVVCAAPVKVGAKFCKRCGSAQPESAAAAATPRSGATRQAHADEADDDNEKTVILSPEAREAMMAQAKAAALRTQAPQAPAPAPDVSDLFASPSEPRVEAPQPAPAPPVRQEPSRRVPPATAPDTPERSAAKEDSPKRNYLAIGLGIAAFLVAALVSALLLMSGHPSDPPANVGDTGPSLPLTDAPPVSTSAAMTPPAAVEPAPVEASAPVDRVAPPPIATPAPTPAAAAAPPQVVAPTPTPTPAPAPAVQATKPPPADTADKKPKKPKADTSAAKRKQAEEALQRLLNQ